MTLDALFGEIADPAKSCAAIRAAALTFAAGHAILITEPVLFTHKALEADATKRATLVRAAEFSSTLRGAIQDAKAVLATNQALITKSAGAVTAIGATLLRAAVVVGAIRHTRSATLPTVIADLTRITIAAYIPAAIWTALKAVALRLALSHTEPLGVTLRKFEG